MPARDLAEGATVLAELQRENAVMDEIATATKTKNFEKLDDALSKASQISIAPEKLQPVSSD